LYVLKKAQINVHVLDFESRMQAVCWWQMASSNEKRVYFQIVWLMAFIILFSISYAMPSDGGVQYRQIIRGMAFSLYPGNENCTGGVLIHAVGNVSDEGISAKKWTKVEAGIWLIKAFSPVLQISPRHRHIITNWVATCGFIVNNGEEAHGWIIPFLSHFDSMTKT
jgi:hypothetical protein